MQANNYLGIDYGKKRIGLALGRIFPRGAGVIENTYDQKLILDISEMCKAEEIDKIIIGIPIRSDRTEGDLVPEIKSFGQKIGQETGLPVEYEEEQLTSVEAEKILAENRGEKGYKELAVDELAAVLILEQYIGGEQSDSKN